MTVIVLLVGVLFFLKRLYGFKPTNKLTDKHINIVEILPLNQRQKIILCNVNGQEILLAVSGQSITSLAHWSTTEPNLKEELSELSKKNTCQNNETAIDREISTKSQLKNTNELLILAKKVNQSIRKNISEKMQ